VNIDGRKIMQEARMVKLPEEQQMFRRLANVLDGCFGVIAKTARPGVPEYEVLGAAARYALSHYVSPDGGYILSGQHTWPKDQSRQCTDRKLRVGDTVVIDLYNYKYFGYCSCYYRTFSIGTAAKDVKETYNEVVTMLIEAEKILKPGITTKDVVEKWKDEIELWSNKPPFIRDERDSLSTFMNNMGHGLGLMTVYDPPFFWRPISLKYPQKLEAGMVIALETQGGTPDNRCGVRVEDMIIITDGGYEVISRWPKEEITELPLY
jgi:Xaa-Pro aminopeptidase